MNYHTVSARKPPAGLAGLFQIIVVKRANGLEWSIQIAGRKSAASTGEKIYSSQVDRLASKTGDQVARYLSQYSATEGWIPKNRAKSVNLAAR